MWEETLVFTVHMPELALVRFLVWDHDPIGQDFIGQRTIAFDSMMPGKAAEDAPVCRLSSKVRCEALAQRWNSARQSEV